MVIEIVALKFTIALVVGILVAIVALKRKMGREPIEGIYRTFFIMGIICVPFSIVSMIIYFILQIPFFIGFPLFALGVVYLIIGLNNRNKWQKVR